MERAIATIGKIPPQNLDAEQSTLGSMMIEKSALEKGLEILSAEDSIDQLIRRFLMP